MQALNSLSAFSDRVQQQRPLCCGQICARERRFAFSTAGLKLLDTFFSCHCLASFLGPHQGALGGVRVGQRSLWLGIEIADGNNLVLLIHCLDNTIDALARNHNRIFRPIAKRLTDIAC